MSFTIKNRMVLNFEVVILLEKILDLIRKVVRAETSLGSSKVVKTSGDPHVSENVLLPPNQSAVVPNSVWHKPAERHPYHG